jgi:hypothetical protein
VNVFTLRWTHLGVQNKYVYNIIYKMAIDTTGMSLRTLRRLEREMMMNNNTPGVAVKNNRSNRQKYLNSLPKNNGGNNIGIKTLNNHLRNMMRGRTCESFNEYGYSRGRYPCGINNATQAQRNRARNLVIRNAYAKVKANSAAKANAEAKAKANAEAKAKANKNAAAKAAKKDAKEAKALKEKKLAARRKANANKRAKGMQF